MNGSLGAASVMLLAAALLTWPGGRLVPGRSRRRAARVAERVAERVRVLGWLHPRPSDPTPVLLQVLEAVAAQVRGGAVPSRAWDAAVDVLGAPAGHLPRAAGGEPLADALRQVAGPDRVVTSVAAAWSLAEDVGAPLADVLDQLSAGLRSEADVDAEVEASLAAPRATARLLAALPVAGLGLGELIGAHPLQVLVGTPVGRLSAVCGVVLALVGHLWSRRLVTRAASTP